MANKTVLALVIDEMVENAAKQIGFEHCQENVDQVLMDMEQQWAIKVNLNGPIDLHFMECFCETLQNWQRETDLNYSERHSGRA